MTVSKDVHTDSQRDHSRYRKAALGGCLRLNAVSACISSTYSF
jgi:hypothetical protein